MNPETLLTERVFFKSFKKRRHSSEIHILSNYGAKHSRIFCLSNLESFVIYYLSSQIKVIRKWLFGRKEKGLACTLLKKTQKAVDETYSELFINMILYHNILVLRVILDKLWVNAICSDSSL